MAAISELFIILIYVILAVASLTAITFVLLKKKPYRYYFAVIAIFLTLLLVKFINYQNEIIRKTEMKLVGVYYLTNYPECANCVLTLDDKMTYTVVSEEKVVDSGNWNHKQGGDYIITTLISKSRTQQGQLGMNDLQYQIFEAKYKFSK